MNNWTRASDALYDSLCLARWRMQRDIPEPPPSDDAEEGRKVHDALAKGDPSGLTVDQRKTYDDCLTLTDRLLVQYFGPQAEEAKQNAVREKELVYRFKHEGQQLEHRGHPDVVFRAGPKVFIPDYKTLYGDHDDAEVNKQLRDYIVMYYRSTVMVRETGTAIIQPKATWKPQLCVYYYDDIVQSENEMVARIVQSHGDNPATAGHKQCRYCLAKTKCEAYQKWAGAQVPAPKGLIDLPVESWSPEQRALFCDRFDAAQSWLNTCWEFCYRGALKDPSFVPGYTMTPGNIMKTAQTHCLRTQKPQELFERFTAIGGTLEEYMKCVGVINAAFKEIIAAKLKLRGKALDEKLDELYRGLVETKQNAPMLKKEKKKGQT